MMSEFCNREELHTQWVSTLQCAVTEDVAVAIYSMRQSLYEEPLLRTKQSGEQMLQSWGDYERYSSLHHSRTSASASGAQSSGTQLSETVLHEGPQSKKESTEKSLFDNSLMKLFDLWEVELYDFCSAWLRYMFKKKIWCICSLELTVVCLGSPPAHSSTHSFHTHVLGASCTSGPHYRASCHALRHARTWHSWHLTAVELRMSKRGRGRAWAWQIWRR